MIKFRAWLKEKKGFAEPGDFSGHGFYLNNIPEWDENNNISLWDFDGNVEYNQYTGLKDKNGQDIYEGDILKVPDFYETPESTYPTYHHEEVIYANHGFGTSNAMFYEDGDYISEECEVIGNKYQHPHLLEKS